MAENLSGYWFLDSLDLWDNFKTGIQKSSTDALKFPPKKESLEYNWMDQHGIDVDHSAPKFSARDITLNCFIDCDSTEEFNEMRDALIAQLMQPGLRTLKVAAHGVDKIYYLEYKSCSGFEAVKSLKTESVKNVHKFSLNMREPDPSNSASARMVDESGRYIIG